MPRILLLCFCLLLPSPLIAQPLSPDLRAQFERLQYRAGDSDPTEPAAFFDRLVDAMAASRQALDDTAEQVALLVEDQRRQHADFVAQCNRENICEHFSDHLTELHGRVHVLMDVEIAFRDRALAMSSLEREAQEFESDFALLSLLDRVDMATSKLKTLLDDFADTLSLKDILLSHELQTLPPILTCPGPTCAMAM